MTRPGTTDRDCTGGCLQAVDLYSGPGGVTTGYKATGVRVIAAVDTDKQCGKTYAANHPEVRLFDDDLSTLDPAALLTNIGLKAEELDILTACMPCQTFSTLSVKNRKIDDPRNVHVERLAEFVKAVLPRAVVMENVPELSRETRFMNLITHLRSAGYGVWFDIVHVADFGVPQSRRRLVLIALRGVADEIVPQLKPDHPLLSNFVERCTVRQTFELLKNISSHDPLHVARTTYPDVVAQRINAVPKNGGSRADLPATLRLECHKRLKNQQSGAGNVYGRMKWDDVAPTMTTRCITPSCGRFLHPEENRAITLREAACLQTFPVDYTFKGGVMAVQAQIGNAVPPRLAQVIAVVVADALAKECGKSV